MNQSDSWEELKSEVLEILLNAHTALNKIDRIGNIPDGLEESLSTAVWHLNDFCVRMDKEENQ